jgi:hypothetical protein
MFVPKKFVAKRCQRGDNSLPIITKFRIEEPNAPLRVPVADLFPARTKTSLLIELEINFWRTDKRPQPSLPINWIFLVAPRFTDISRLHEGTHSVSAIDALAASAMNTKVDRVDKEERLDRKGPSRRVPILDARGLRNPGP